MGYELNERIKNLKPYEVLQGDFKIRLDANESFVKLTDEIKEQIADKVKENAFNRYPSSEASDICQAFANFYGVDKEMVVAGNGSDELISIIVSTFFNKGDKLLTLSPDFSMYNFYAQIYGIENVVFEKNADHTFNIDDVINYAEQNKINGIIFSNPCNPTSVGISQQEVIKLIESLTDCLIIVDEAYMDFWNQGVLQIASKYDNVIVLKTCSKALANANIRLGFAVANNKIITAIKGLKSPYNVNGITQIIGDIILSNQDFLNGAIKTINETFAKFYSDIKDLQDKVRGKEFEFELNESKTNFVLLRTPKAEHIYKNLLKNSIVVRQFGNLLRINTGSEEENQALLDCLKKIMGV